MNVCTADVWASREAVDVPVPVPDCDGEGCTGSRPQLLLLYTPGFSVSHPDGRKPRLTAGPGGDDAGARQQSWILLRSHKSKGDDDGSLFPW